MKNNSADATHTNKDGKHLYRICVKPWSWQNPFRTGVEFWDVHCNIWRPSIMRKSELKEIKPI